MSRQDECVLASKMSHAADVLSVDALPGGWPDWMTPEKRRDLAASFGRQANEIAAKHGMRSMTDTLYFGAPGRDGERVG